MFSLPFEADSVEMKNGALRGDTHAPVNCGEQHLLINDGLAKSFQNKVFVGTPHDHVRDSKTRMR